MMAPHTIAHMRKDYFMGNGVTDRSGRAKWEKDGRQDARERARAIARKLLATEDDGRLPEEVDRAIRQRFEILL